MGKKDWKKLWEEEVTDEHLMKYEGAGIRYTFYDSSENYHIDNEGVSTSNFFSYTIIEHLATSHHLTFPAILFSYPIPHLHLNIPLISPAPAPCYTVLIVPLENHAGLGRQGVL